MNGSEARPSAARATIGAPELAGSTLRSDFIPVARFPLLDIRTNASTNRHKEFFWGLKTERGLTRAGPSGGGRAHRFRRSPSTRPLMPEVSVPDRLAGAQ